MHRMCAGAVFGVWVVLGSHRTHQRASGATWGIRGVKWGIRDCHGAQTPEAISGKMGHKRLPWGTRVRENAKEQKVTFYNELSRVLVHGVLHLCGYNDSSEAEKAVMRSKENEYLAQFFSE